MAKIYYSGLVNTMSGRLGTTVYAKIRGVDYCKTYPLSPADPKSYRQLQIRANLTTLTTAYGNLPTTTQQLWDAYTKKARIQADGRAGYIHLNGALLNASHAALCAHTYPPPRPSTPRHVTGFCVYPLSSTCMCITWTRPHRTDNYVEARFRLHLMFCCVYPAYNLCPTTGYRKSWRFISTVRSDQTYLLHHHDWPLKARLYYHLRTIDTYGRQSPITHTLFSYTDWSPWFFICDSTNHRIHERTRSLLSKHRLYGTQGAGNAQFETPAAIAADNAFLYIADTGNNRLKLHRRSDFSYCLQVGSLGAGDDQFWDPRGIATDELYLYTTETGNDRVQKRLKSDLSYVCKIGTFGAGDDQFSGPRGIAVDDTHIYIADAGNNRISKRLKSDLSFVANIGTWGAGDGQFKNPLSVAVDDTHLYVSDTNNHRIQKLLKSDGTFVAKIGSHGTGNDQFDGPLGIALDDTHVYIADRVNDRIHKRLKSDLSFVQIIGTTGAGDDQFQDPRGICIQQAYQ